MNEVVWLDVAPNPDWKGPWPDRHAPRCHDGSGYMEVVCPCGAPMHIHRSQLNGMPDDADVITGCKTCGRTLGMEGLAVRNAIDQMWAP